MQYLLSEDEFSKLNTEHMEEVIALKNTVNDLCRRVANSELVPQSWVNKGKAFPEPWGCRIDQEGNVDDNWYCDDCPVKLICGLIHKTSK